MAKAMNLLRWVTALFTVTVIALLVYQCIDIYFTGNRPENIHGSVYLSPVFSAEIVAQRLSLLTPVLGLYILLVTVGLILQKIFPTAKKLPSPQPISYRDFPHASLLRLVLLCLSVVFIILGVMNGGARDVLVKAINICTECIGLG